jgi:hypothetical protein
VKKKLEVFSIKTSPKGFSAFKCDIGNCILLKSWEFLGNSLGLLLGLLWDFFGTSLGLLWDFFGTSLGLLWDFFGKLFEYGRN